MTQAASRTGAISMSKKRATVMFNLPAYGRVTVQEAVGKPSPELRRAIEVARDAFFKEFFKGDRPCPK